MRRWRPLAAILLIVGVALPLISAPTDAVAVAQADQGLNGGWAIDDGGNTMFQHSLSSSLSTVHDAGAGWVRLVFRLGGCYTDWTSVGCDGHTALQRYDDVLARIHGQNLRVLGVLTGESWPGSQSDWTANNAETVAGGNGDNPYARGFAAGAASVLAGHFAGQVLDWEVWNEPNAWTGTDNTGHFFGGSYLYPSNYAWLLERSYVAIKIVQPTSTVVLGGLFAHQPLGVPATIVVNGQTQRVTKRGDMPGARRPAPRPNAFQSLSSVTCASGEPAGADSGASYLCATYNVGLGYVGWTPAGFPFDDIGQHLYVALGTSVSSGTLVSYLQDLRQAYVAYEGPLTTKRTQVTEVGWPTDQVGPDVQRSNLQVTFQTLRSVAYVGRTYWFNTQDAPEAPLYYGLVDTNGAPKPAYFAFQQNATFTAPPRPTAVPPSTPTPTATSTPTATATLTSVQRTPVPCAPRAAIRVGVAAMAPGVLQVTLTAGSGALQSVQIGAATNASIDAGSIVGATANFRVTIPAGATQLQLTVRRVVAGQAVTVPLVITDACGPWPTFVGGGPAGF